MIFKESRVFLSNIFKLDVRKRLENMNLTQRNLSNIVKVSPSTLCYYLNGECSIPLSIYAKILNFLGLPDKYTNGIKTYEQIRKEVGIRNKGKIPVTAFKSGISWTIEYAKKGGKASAGKRSKEEERKVGKILGSKMFSEKRGIFNPEIQSKLKEIGRNGGYKSGPRVVERRLGIFSPKYYKFDEYGCQSYAERKVYDFLTKNGIKVISVNKESKLWLKYTDENMRKHYLRFDFYLPEKNIFIEVCGRVLNNPFYNKRRTVSIAIKHYPNIKLILIVSDKFLAKKHFGNILNKKQILNLIEIKNMNKLISALN